MADLATPSAAQISTSGAAKIAPKQTSSVVKPEKPDEEAYKAELAKAEKELKAAEERMVRSSVVMRQVACPPGIDALACRGKKYHGTAAEH
jgi:Spy/CpxP family protein refolding chaperone